MILSRVRNMFVLDCCLIGPTASRFVPSKAQERYNRKLLF